MPRPLDSSFNHYAVLQQKADPPAVSWWVGCDRAEFAARATREALRMSLSPIAKTVSPRIVDWIYP